MRNTRKAFTLVELIVVITILAILGTIAFISLSGYSSDARNSKRTSDLKSIISSMSTKQTEGVSLLALVDGTGSNLTDLSVAGFTGAALGINSYKAGDVNYTTLGIKEEDFSDPEGEPYVLGVTSKINGKYEIAAKLENGSGEPTAKVEGTYIPRVAAGVVVTPTSGNKFKLVNPSADINKFQKGDMLSGGAQVIGVSSDLEVLTLSTGATSPITLAFDESDGLIAASGGTDIVKDGFTILPY